MLQATFLIVLLPLIMVNCESIDPWKLDSIVQFVKGIADTERNLMDSLGDKDSASAISDTLGRMREADQKITNLTQIIAPIKNFFSLVNHMRPSFAIDHHFVKLFERVDIGIERIKKLYETYVQLSTEESALNEKQLNKWINASISDKPIDGKMFSEIIGSEKTKDKSMFHVIAHGISELRPRDKCGFQLSMQQRVDYSLTVVLVYQLKAFLTTVYAQTLNAIRTKETDKSVYDKREADTVLRILQYMLAAQSAMKLMVDSRKVIACDAKEKTPETYTSFSHLFSNILISLADTRSERTCAHWCRDVENVQAESCDPNSPYCAARPCYGLLNKCIEIEKTTICELPAESNRRYEWFLKDSNEKYYGQVTDCERYGSEAVLREADAYKGRDGRSCSLCFCECTETRRKSTATRFVSLIPQLADIAENKVVTGIKIFESEHMIQMQIKQGTLMGKGHIDTSTNQWKENQKLRYQTDYDEGNFGKYNNEKNRWDIADESEDYMILNNDIKLIFIDDIVLEKDYVVTGARWGFLKESQYMKGIRIEVYATKYDHTTGKLDTTDSRWVTPQNMTVRQKEFYGRTRNSFLLYDRDDPLRAPYNEPMLEPNTVLGFTYTDRGLDAGQLTVPFFDTQKVEIVPPVALSGLSVYYRGKEGFGGFIGLGLIAVDLSDGLTTEIEKDDLEKYKKDFSDVLVYI